MYYMQFEMPVLMHVPLEGMYEGRQMSQVWEFLHTAQFEIHGVQIPETGKYPYLHTLHEPLFRHYAQFAVHVLLLHVDVKASKEYPRAHT